MSVCLESCVLGRRRVGVYMLIYHVVCAMGVCWVLLLVWVLSLQCLMDAVTAVIGPGEGVSVGVRVCVCRWYTQYGWCVRC